MTDQSPRWIPLRAAAALAVVVFSIAATAIAADAPEPPESPLPEKVRFNRDIRPIMSNICFACHGPDESARKAKLRLDVRDQAIADRKGVRPLVPGSPADSEAWLLISSDDADEQMPPADFHVQLTARDKALIKRWIEQGAEYEDHWAFIPAKRPATPRVAAGGAVRNAIDAFVLERLAAEGVKPQKEADRRTLIRRVSFDLTGLPPTPAEIDAFVGDTASDAYERVVDRLLASPRYGEHMARFWLDAARYADTNGYQYDLERDQWVWRDWVIAAYNSNMPFDRFTIEQMAGDLLPAAEATDQTRLATGFHRNHPITIEGGVIDEEYRTEYVMDRVVVTSTTWMGLTFLCARCHTHKYDPISHEEFYSFYAFFNNVPERGLNGFDPRAKIASPLATDATQIDAELAKAQAEFAEAKRRAGPAAAAWEQRLRDEQAGAWRATPVTSATSAGGATLSAQDDASVLAGGKNPGTDTYEAVIAVGDQPAAALRLEALTHPSLTQGSASRGSNGNFVLSEIEVEAAPAGEASKFNRVKIASAAADYEQSGYPISAALNGQKGKDGWAVDGNTKPENRTAVFAFAEPVAAGSTLRVRLIHNWGMSHQIGRFRLSLARSAAAPTPPEVHGALAASADKRTPQQAAALDAYLATRYGGAELAAPAKRIDELLRRRSEAPADVPATLILAEMPKPRQAYVLDRGEYDKPLKDKPVTPRVPAALGTLPEGAPANRLGLAMWMVAKDNPLTARVTVNRFWAQLFGTGLVKTVEDFGSQGEYPSHPDLLDWLAVEFVESGWDVKHILKTIVTSGTYRQSSVAPPDMLARDPENRLLARGPRIRLDAEQVRDGALAVSGLLVEKLGGPSVFPYHPPGLWEEINNRPGYSRVYKQQSGEALYRRSMYSFWKRTVPPPSMATFDAPEREFCVVRRSRTNTPLQAFVLLHDPQFVEAARALGRRMITEGGRTMDERLAYGFTLCTARTPTDAELAVLRKTCTARLAQYRADTAAAEKVLAVGESPRDASIDPAEHAAYAVVARLMINLSEFVTKD